MRRAMLRLLKALGVNPLLVCPLKAIREIKANRLAPLDGAHPVPPQTGESLTQILGGLI